ncbi:hypothetical protein [Nisaea sp.]|uniref:hypothetical protein n=1 Tax=Nisaea sp. TaxID=2024842 RepID=UPI0032EE6638
MTSEAGKPVSDMEEWPAGMKIVNGHLAKDIREQGMIQPPNSFGYIHLAAEVERPHPLKRNSAEKKALLASLKTAAAALRAAEPERVQRVDLFDAFVIPPGSKEGRELIARSGYDVHLAAFDIVVLVECSDVDTARSVRDSEAFVTIQNLLTEGASHTHCFVGSNAKRIAEVDHDRDGIFLFNYFYAADIAAKGADGIDILLGVWEYTAGWWTAYANLTNSTPLQPVAGEKSDYSLINHCRWDRLADILPHLLFRPSLGRFVLANFTANDIMAMPILYRLAK